MSDPPADDPYRRFRYRRLIAWPERIARERSFLESQLRRSPEPSVVDLGCGTGEHALFFASLGIDSLGVDRSAEMIGEARDYEDRHPPHGPRFAEGDFAALGELTDRRFGAAFCLGNVLPHLEDADLATCLAAWAERLVEGGRLVIQIVNYERILGGGLRHLPLSFRQHPDEAGEIVFLRLVTPAGDRHVLFHPTTLRLLPGSEEPVTVKATREVRLRAWRRPELEPMLERAGFEVDALHGDMTEGPFEPATSPDLVVVAVRG